MSIAWVFPGQGSQKLGMADSIIGLPGAKERFALASEILQRDLLAVCSGTSALNNELGNLNDTRNTQPALFVVESLIADDLRNQGREPSLLAGHSLGELVALYVADVFNAETALNLLLRRSELMAAAAGGTMTAVLGFQREELEELVMRTEGVVIANDNSSSQVVLSGTPEAVASLTNKLNCKRSISLPVSGAFHSPHMAEASLAFEHELDLVKFHTARIPVISNSNPIPSCDGSQLKQNLKHQMTTGVRWRETMNILANEGINTTVEIGPGNVLTGLIKRSLSQMTTSQIASAKDLGY